MAHAGAVGMKSAERARVAVVGAGIVGVSAALWLARAGAAVTVIDRAEIGGPDAASYGNAGVLAACSVAPVTAPGLALKGPRLLLDPDFPLFLRMSYLPRLAPWLVRYLSHANDRDTRRIAAGLAPLIADAVDQHRALAGGTEAAEWLASSDYGFVYLGRAAFDADPYPWMLRRQFGFEPEIVEGAAVREVEPSLSPDLGLLALVRDHGFVRDPGKYVRALAVEARKLGVVFHKAEVRDFEFADGRIRAVETSDGRVECDAAAICGGVWSRPLALKLGLKVPMETERGYHIEYRRPNVTPRIPLMITTGKFVATPMAGGLRCAGVVEFGGLKAGPSRPPLALLGRKVRQTFPDLRAAEEVEWLGHRPAPSDSLPLIGEIAGTRVFAGFGHHHIGLTAGPKTGRILAGLITGRRENTDVSAYDPMRF